ncbi:MAG: metallophosphatase domain-containing protein [Rubripirellula sp.]
MRFVAISDTHGCHRQLDLPAGDVLIHAGDVCDRGSHDQVEDFFLWMSDLPFSHKCLIWGNHDFDLSTNRVLFPVEMPSSITRLNDSECLIGGLRIWGVPSPANKRGEDWSRIPPGIDVLVTHRPPIGILDRPKMRGPQGSRGLKKRLLDVTPRVHVFGHIHHGYGQETRNQTRYINASLYRSSLKRLVNSPIVFDLE